MWFRKKGSSDKLKIKNNKKLKDKGIDTNDHLPILDPPQFRKPVEIAERMMVLMAIFQLYLEAPRNIIKSWIETNGLSGKLTKEELSYLSKSFQDLSDQDKTSIYWSIEALWAFAWAGGFHDNLTYNTPVEDSLASMLPNISENESPQAFINRFRLRPESELTEILDGLYRAHWFAKNNSLRGIKSELVDLDIIMERRKALEYVCYQENEWDDISLDT